MEKRKKIQFLLQCKSSLIPSWVRQSKRSYSENLATSTWVFLALRSWGSEIFCLAGFLPTASLPCPQPASWGAGITHPNPDPFWQRGVMRLSQWSLTHISLIFFSCLYSEAAEFADVPLCVLTSGWKISIKPLLEFCAGITDLQRCRESHHVEHYKSGWGMYHLGKIAFGTTHLSVSSFSDFINQTQTSVPVSE